MQKEVIELYNIVKDTFPVLGKIFNDFNDFSIYEYSKNFKKTSNFPKSRNNTLTSNSQEELIKTSTEYIIPLLGEQVATYLESRLKNSANILTANHHSPDFCNIPVQGNIIFSLSEEKNSIIPVFSFGNIPLNNPSFPRGILLANQIKLSLFPDKYKHKLVHCCPGFTTRETKKVLSFATSYFSQGKITEKQKLTISNIIKELYASKRILNTDTYAKQTPIINYYLWKNLFSDELQKDIPDICYIEIEHISSRLLECDLSKSDSLISLIFFNEKIRYETLLKLDKEQGCWNYNTLFCINSFNNSRHKNLIPPSGTIFFWGLDKYGKKFPLFFTDKHQSPLKIKDTDCQKLNLSGFSNKGEYFSIPFTPESIIKNLRAKNILPSLFASFVIISLARGFKCYGGFMQAEYLTKFSTTLLDILYKNKIFDYYHFINQIETKNYCTGLQFIAKSFPEKIYYPAGTTEIIEEGGLNSKNLDNLKTISFREAQYLGLPDIYPALVKSIPQNARNFKLKFHDIAQGLKDKLIIF